YAAVYLQRRLGILDEPLWQPFQTELETLVNLEAARKFWDRKKDQKQYDAEFERLLEKLIVRSPSEESDK
ncbi:MAG TPA: hypothetical protein VLU25_04965, partial [Acidobacteriota bacterium]|nr:hypothetical protein [Acidobacteriota bacterium]